MTREAAPKTSLAASSASPVQACLLPEKNKTAEFEGQNPASSWSDQYEFMYLRCVQSSRLYRGLCDIPDQSALCEFRSSTGVLLDYIEKINRSIKLIDFHAIYK